MADSDSRRGVFRFTGRSVTDAARRARADLGENTALLDVRTVQEESGEEKTEIVVAVMDRIGIPSLIEFINRPADASKTESRSSTQDLWPPRFQRVMDGLLRAGVGEDQAAILVREAVESATGLDAMPWETVEEVATRLAPCSAPLDLTTRQVFGLAGRRESGRTTVAQEICRMAGAVVPDRILLVTADDTVVPEAGFDVSYNHGAAEAAHTVSFNDELRIVLVDLPPLRDREPGLGFASWMTAFPDLTLIPVVANDQPLSDAMSLIRRCSDLRSTGWILSWADHDTTLGLLINLALAIGGPLGLQGRAADAAAPRLQLAHWKTIFERVRQQLGEEFETAHPQTGGGEGEDEP